MTDHLKIALAQLNPLVGDIQGNVEKAKAAWAQAKTEGADLVLFTELFLTGYPPEDLVLKPAFADAARAAAEELAALTADGGPGLLIGTVWPQREADRWPGEAGKLYNAVVLLEAGKVAAVRFKVDLPTYGVFDETRVFAPGPLPGPINFRGVRLGVPICEDIWSMDVCECLEETGAEILLVPNGSPFDQNKPDVRVNIAVARVRETRLPLAYVNQVGGQDELVFDGASFVLNADCALALQLPAWQEALIITEWTRGPGGDAGAGDGKADEDGAGATGWSCAKGELAVLPEGDGAAYHACVLGLRDYVDKTGFPSVVLGLSGGIDSALVAAMAVDALGASRVHCIMLPFKYTSDDSLSDAAACAKALGVRYDIVPIEAPVSGFTSALAALFDGSDSGVTEENIQSRTRGAILMAVSNKFGGMVLTTGNKSEMSVGYATLYGDMNGGFNPIKDLYKLQVYALSRWRNAHVPTIGRGCGVGPGCGVGSDPSVGSDPGVGSGSQVAKGPAGEVIPVNIITKAPTAELREGQLDQDSLPPYEVLDDILECLVEREMPLPQIVARGHDAALVKRIEGLLYIAEYKRRQAAPGVKISSRNFGRDRRYPIQNKFREQL